MNRNKKIRAEIILTPEQIELIKLAIKNTFNSIHLTVSLISESIQESLDEIIR